MQQAPIKPPPARDNTTSSRSKLLNVERCWLCNSHGAGVTCNTCPAALCLEHSFPDSCQLCQTCQARKCEACCWRWPSATYRCANCMALA